MICRALDASSKDCRRSAIVDIKQCVYSVVAERCCHDRHDVCPNSWRARPPEWQGRMGELYHLMVKVTQVQRGLNRWHRWHEVWSGADKVTSWLELDELVVDKERQRQMRRKELSVLWVNGYVEGSTHSLHPR